MGMKNITLDNITKVCDGTLFLVQEGVRKEEARGVVLDSRQVKEGYVFLATRGERVDGHSFIHEVFEKGAMAVICEKLPEPLTGDCILVEDSFEALKKLARFYRSQLTIPVIGITGSVGKTSTKEFIAGVLSAKYNVGKTIGNFNNEIGLPLTVLSLRKEHEVAVLEMGISDFGEMSRLSEIARPDYCVLTNIGECHLENLHDRDGVLKAKSEIFKFMNQDGCIIVNGDDDKLATLKDKYDNVITFGRKKENDVVAAAEESRGLKGSFVSIGGRVELSDLTIPLPGEHMVLNALAAAAVAELLGLTEEEIKSGMEKVQSVSGRSNLIFKNDMTIIDDCYNANPVSMKAAIELLQWALGRKIAVLGDMFELGEREKQLHYETGAYAVNKVDCLICVGSLSRAMYEGAMEKRTGQTDVFYMEDKSGVKALIDTIKQPGDTFLVKASHSMGFEKIVSDLKI